MTGSSTTGNTDAFCVLFIKPHTPTPHQMIEIPLGIMYLSACLKTAFGHRVRTELLDLRMCDDPQRELQSCLERTKPRLIGISMQVFEQSFLKICVDMLTSFSPEAHIIVGGPYATTHYDDFLQDRRIGAAVIGEGENVLINIVGRMLDGRDYADLKGIARNNGTEILPNEPEPYIENLDALPFPDYDLINLEHYWRDHISMNMVLADRKYVQIISSRACPYHCAYCHNMFGKKLRQRSPENVLEEIGILHRRHGVREFHFVDDAFNIDRDRMRRLLNLIIQTGLPIHIAFPNGLRADRLERDDLDLMRRAGVYMVTFAVESASARIQEIIHKNLNLARVTESIRHANRIGLITKGFFMLGFPYETAAEIRQTIKFALDSDFDLVSFFKVIPFYRTELFEMARQFYPRMGKNAYTNYLAGRSFYEDATGFNVNPLQKKAYLRFYSPFRLLRLYRKVPMKKHFTRFFLSAAREVLKT